MSPSSTRATQSDRSFKEGKLKASWPNGCPSATAKRDPCGAQVILDPEPLRCVEVSNPPNLRLSITVYNAGKRSKTMKKGRCALCLQDGKAICESHLIAEGIYWRAGEDRVVMTSQIFVSISNQVKDYLLCRECEAKFGAAENYILPLVRQHDASFPLLEKLKASEPLGPTVNGSLVYSGPAVGIDVDTFAYFALSMFWRASVHVWKTLNGQPISMPLRSWE